MNDYWLSKGSHKTAADGRCAMEFVAYLAGEPHSDTPECVCPVLTRFCIGFNDGLDDENRQRLRPYLARTIGTRGDGLGDHRAWLATDWLIRAYVPAWLASGGWDDGRLRALPPVTAASLDEAMIAVDRARRWALTQAAWPTPRWPAARCRRQRDAAVTWAAAAIAAVEGAPYRVPADGNRAARAVAADWAEDAAAAIALHVCAIEGATDGALAPMVAELQESAFDLLDRMLPLVPIRLPVAEDAAAVCALPA